MDLSFLKVSAFESNNKINKDISIFNKDNIVNKYNFKLFNIEDIDLTNPVLFPIPVDYNIVGSGKLTNLVEFYRNYISSKVFAQEIIKALRDIEKELGPDSEGCVIIRGNDEKFWCTGLELDEADANPFANNDGFFPVIECIYSLHHLTNTLQLLATLLDYPFPTIALLTGHTFGGACPFSLAQP